MCPICWPVLLSSFLSKENLLNVKRFRSSGDNSLNNNFVPFCVTAVEGGWLGKNFEEDVHSIKIASCSNYLQDFLLYFAKAFKYAQISVESIEKNTEKNNK